MRLAIITTHPIQYNAPLFKELAKQITLKVFYTWSQSQKKIIDKDFGIERSWDIPLLEGYDYTFVNNVAANPGSSHFRGINNPTLIQEVESWKPGAILIFGWAFVSHLRALRQFHKRIPVLFRGDSTLLNEPLGFSIKKILRRIFLKWVYRHIDYALYVGKYNKQYFVTHGIKEQQLIFAPHAIDNERFAEVAVDVEKKRESLNIDASDLVFLFAGKFYSLKNPDLLIRSFLLAIKENPSIKLIIAGNGELEDFLKKRYLKESNIIFIGFQNQMAMPALYKIADVFVLPSKSETWGLAVNEAMACGRPVLVSDKCGCVADLVYNDVNGYVFKSDDVEDLSYKISMMLDKQKLERMGNASVNIIKKWSYKEIIHGVKGLINDSDKR